MGAAAPSRRRWIVPSLLALAGASFFAVGIGVVGDLRSSSVVDPEGAVDGRIDPGSMSTTPFGPATARTVTVTLEPGWDVPELSMSDDGGGDGRFEDVAEPGERETGALTAGDRDLRPGAATFGATQPVPDDATMAIVHGAAPLGLAVRTNDGDRQGQWQAVDIDADEGPDALPGDEGHGDRPIAGGPIWLGTDIDEIEFVVVAGEVASLELTFLGSSDVEPDLSPAGAVAGGVASAAAQPPIIPREQWAAAEWDYQKPACDEGPSVADHTRAVVVHHTVTTNSYAESDVDDLLRAIYYSHVVVNGWCDVGYNFVVDRFGRIWETRTGSIEASVIGGHARGFNSSTVGIALLGQHHQGARPRAASPSAAAASAVESLAAWKLGIHGVDPAGRTWLRNRSSTEPLRLEGQAWHYVPAVLGHRDLGVTSCPGGEAIGLVRDLPGRLAAARDLSLPYRFVDWQAHSHGPGFVVADRRGGLRPAGAATPWSQAPAGLSGTEPVIAVGGNLAGGYLLVGSGELIGFGSAPAIGQPPAGAAAAVDIVVRSDGQSGWVLDGQGRLAGFGGLGDLAPSSTVGVPVAASIDDGGNGYVLAADGTLAAVGGAPPASIAGPAARAVAVDLDMGPGGEGWVLDAAGRLYGFGAVGGATHRVEPPAAVLAVAAADSGPGGWVLDAEGQLWPFGGARLVFPVSTSVTTGDAVDVANVGSVYGPTFVNGDDARFVDAVYRLFLGREPSIVETDLEVTGLEQGREPQDITSFLARSEQWSGGIVDEMYRQALGREPDPEGRAYWLAQIAAGLRLQELGTYFYGSTEYAGRAGSVPAYVTKLYDVLLSRPPDEDGLAYWVQELTSGRAKPPDVANGFYASIESRRDRADRLARRIFGEPLPAGERDAWAERLATDGDAGVAAAMAASPGYYRLVVDGPAP